jgi:23S rRNA pseudouridine1911/1915/1917 synthase
MEIRVPTESESQRLDLFLSSTCPDLSRSRIQQLIKTGAVTVNDGERRASYAVRVEDLIFVDVPAPELSPLAAEAIPLSIIHEDEDLLVLDKPAGMIVHPAPRVNSGTLVNALLHHCRDLSGIGGVLRPGIVHRLDKHTTGLLVVAKSDRAHRGLAEQLETRSMRRAYIALVWGIVDVEEDCIEAPIGRHPRDRKRQAVVKSGRAAITRLRTLRKFDFTTMLAVKLETGRTHQIRVHLQHYGFPVFGDPVYGGRNQTRGIKADLHRRADSLLKLIDRQALHAAELEFEHPVSGAHLQFSAPLPDDFDRLVTAASAAP